jgi:hypothetical protein
VNSRLQKHHAQTEFVVRLINDPTCDICGKDVLTPTLVNRNYRALLVIDHDHSHCPGSYSCGQCLRGKVCSQCNVILGMAADNPAVLRNAATYLESGVRGATPEHR